MREGTIIKAVSIDPAARSVGQAKKHETMPVREQETITIEDSTLRKGFTWIPNGVLRREGLSPGAKLAYMGLLSYAWQEGSCFPGQARLATDLGIGQRSVIRYLKELETVGLLEVRRRGLGKTNKYILPKDDIDEPVPATGKGKPSKRSRKRSGSARLADQEMPKSDSPEVPNWQREEDTGEEDTDHSNLRKGTLERTPKRETKQPVSETDIPRSRYSRKRSFQAVGAYLKGRAPVPPATRNEISSSDREILTVSLEEIAHEFRDTAPASTVTELLRYFEQSKLERITDYLPVIYAARSITRDRKSSIRVGEPGARKMMPYFKEVVKDKLGLRPKPVKSVRKPN